MKLNIQRFAVSKSTSFSESNLNPTQNTSSLTITIYFSANNSVTYFTNTPLYCTCNGVTQSANVSHSRGGSVTKSFTFNDIPHNADGSKSVSWSWNCNTGTSVLGNISDSGTKTLTTLHTPPVVESYTITETNQDLLDIGITDDVFVANLSKKSVNMTYTMYDSATLSQAVAFNNTKGYVSQTLPIIMDFTQNELVLSQHKTTGVLGVPIITRITDSKDGYRYYSNTYGNFSTSPSSGEYRDFYSYIPYIKVNLTNSSTIAKRLGQISGRVGLTINGNFYQGVIGNIDQTSDKPIIKYKFWKYGDSEPSTYDYTIPAREITIQNGTFNVDNYDIGSGVETDTNYFNPEYAYRIKIYVEDNLTSIESNELQIQVGEAVWTEYINRVDFKRITIQGNEVKPDIYSTTETDTGKIWIDGKKIYRKIYKKTTGLPGVDVTANFSISDLNIDRCIYLRGWTYSTQFGFINLDFYNNGGYNYMHLSGNTSLYYRYHYNASEVYFVIEYTKTNN